METISVVLCVLPKRKMQMWKMQMCAQSLILNQSYYFILQLISYFRVFLFFCEGISHKKNPFDLILVTASVCDCTEMIP